MACVDGAIQNYTSRLMDPSLPEKQLQEALMFLVHFIGDIHQPLHVGFASDEGGNTELGRFMTSTNVRLHHVWDTSMIDKRVREDFGNSNITYLQHFMKQLAPGGMYNSQIDSWRQCSNSSEAA